MKKVDIDLYSQDIITKIRLYQIAYQNEKEFAKEATLLENELKNLRVKAEDLDKNWN